MKPLVIRVAFNLRTGQYDFLRGSIIFYAPLLIGLILKGDARVM